jgi:catechol 2,3-dioxygenase-like lactoylglutathione lyase family enzyme
MALIRHVALRCSDMGKSKDFYQTAFGWELIDYRPGGKGLDLSDGVCNVTPDSTAGRLQAAPAGGRQRVHLFRRDRRRPGSLPKKTGRIGCRVRRGKHQAARQRSSSRSPRNVLQSARPGRQRPRRHVKQKRMARRQHAVTLFVPGNFWCPRNLSRFQTGCFSVRSARIIRMSFPTASAYRISVEIVGLAVSSFSSRESVERSMPVRFRMSARLNP